MNSLDWVGFALGFNAVKGSRIVCRANPDTASQPMMDAEREKMGQVLARHSRRFHEVVTGPAFPAPKMIRLIGFRMARTSIRMEQAPTRADPTYYRDRGWFESAYYYPVKLSPLKRAAGAAFDRIAARSSRARAYRPASS